MNTPQVDVALVQQVLSNMPDPETGRGMLKQNQLRDIRVEGSTVHLTVALTTHSAILWEDVCREVRERILAGIPTIEEVVIERVVHPRPAPRLGQIGLTAKSVIAVGSGKGGVGKSTIAACLAYALARAGSRVGLLDADVYGPSIPQLTGTAETKGVATDGNKIVPVIKDGIPIMSIGYLIPPDQAVIWRGPMLHGAVMQFLRDTQWGELDYLIVDMPPGTGDVAITLSQALPLTGAVVVCTPQQLALLDAVKAVAMFRKVNIPVLGMVENMSGFLCPECGKQYDIFGKGGARAKAEELDVPFLGEVPIVPALRERGDAGTTAENLSDPLLGPYLTRVAWQLVKHLAERAARQPITPQLPVLG
ncbi:MAG: iron-sulfur cluster carrier protein [Pirellulaceae bacterium]|nr:MAG: iron-sulfur cluster carrier protein [Pirellulaceae bacterium]